ncbi:unnamed protein product [Rhodiola kirilowii]
MGVGKFVGERKGKEFNELSKEANTKSKKVKRRQKKSSSSSSDTIQKVYETCKIMFASAKTGVVPPVEDVKRLQSVLDSMKPEDVGLSPAMQYFKTSKDGQRPKITYLHLHECDKFSMGIFCLPPSAVIPLHNHPGMTVFNTKRPTEVPLVMTTEEQHAEVRLAKIKADADCTAPCNTSILYPSAGGNLHCFTAKTACAVLDVLGPPYSDSDGRHCTYYLEHPFLNFPAAGVLVPGEDWERYAWLEDRGDPNEFSVVGTSYRGPKITE